jgi:dipeptidyl-peptidase 4
MTRGAVVSTALLAASLAFAPTSAFADRLTVDQIVAADPVSGNPPGNFTWSPDGTRFIYTVISADVRRPPVIHLYDLRSERDRVIFHARSQERGSRSRPISQIVWSPDGRRLAYVNGANLNVADSNGDHQIALAKDVDDPQWSPDGRRLAYVHGNDLYVTTLATRRTLRLTTGGSETRINGDPDWLLSEEMDVEHAYAWAPTGNAIAYLSFDESPVTPFPIVDYLRRDNTVEEQRYPLAGDPNPRVSLHVVDAGNARPRLLFDGGPHDEYVVSFVWTPDGHSVLQEILDRAQRSVRLELFPRDGGPSRTIVRESDPRFVDLQPAPLFLPGGRSFVWLSERRGVQSVELVDLRSGAVRQLGNDRPVGDILRVTSDGIYASALAPTRRDLALVYIPLHGGSDRIVTDDVGWNEVAMPKNGDAYVDSFSSLDTPRIVTIRRMHSQRRSVLFATPSLARFTLGKTLALEIPSRWGALDAVLTVPRDFNPTHRYPVIVAAYGGPLSVGDRLEGSDAWPGLYTHLLAQEGFLVFSVDGPASNFDRAANARLFSHSMGEIAMAGQLAGVAWLKTQTYVDASRLGLWGWSYGGYLTAYTVTHAPGIFRSGIAGAPPADWRFYDTAYTERYMGKPQEYPDAYRRTSVLPAAKNLDSRLLILQGSSDDNVHLMNSITMLEAFVEAGKQVDYFVFPGARHGPTGIPALRILDGKMLDWWEGTL